MTNKLNQFIENVQGQFVEVSDRSNIYQCYDLAALWVIVLGIPKSTIQHLYAYEVYTNPNPDTRNYFDLIPNTPEFIPQDGDIAVFDKTPGNIAGHLGLALGGGGTASFMLFSQNAPLGTSPHLASYHYDNPRLLGVLRPKNQGTPPAPASVLTDQTRIPQIENMEVQAIRSERNDMKKDLISSKQKADKFDRIKAITDA